MHNCFSGLGLADLFESETIKDMDLFDLLLVSNKIASATFPLSPLLMVG